MRWITIVLLLLLPLASLAGDPYGVADFSRNNAWSRAGLKAIWETFDPGTMGDALGGLGDFEEWDDTPIDPDCEECPIGWTCICSTASNTIRTETEKLYKNNASMELTGTGGNTETKYQFTFEANKCYQISFRYMSENGTEDVTMYVLDAGETDTYNVDLDVWDGLWNSFALTNMATSWTRAVSFVKTGVVGKTDYNIWFYFRTGTFYIDDFQIRELHSCDVTGSLENSLTIPTDADPVFGQAEILLPTTGGAPAGSYGMELDNTNDYLPGGDILSPADGSLTVACWTIPRTVVGTHTPISQWHSVVNQCSYLLNFDTDDVKWYVDDDGTGASHTMIEDSDVLVAGTQQRFVATYKQVASGSSEMTLQLNHEAEVVSNVAVAPIHDSTGDFCIGGAHGGANIFDGFIQKCGVWHTALNSVQRSKVLSPYFPGNSHGDGFYVTTCDQANPHATCSAQKCRKGTPHGCQADATGAMPIFGPRNEQLGNNSYEAWDDATTPTGWAVTQTAGSGTAIASREYSRMMHGGSSAKAVTTATDSSVVWYSTCIDITDTTTYYIGGWVFGGPGSDDYHLGYQRYIDDACAVFDSTTYIEVGLDVPEAWTHYGDTTAAWGTTESIIVRTGFITVATTAWIDRVSMKEAAHPTPFCPCASGAAPCTCDARDYRLHNPLSDYIESEGKYGWEDGFCASACIYSDWADDGINHYIFLAYGATVQDENWWYLFKDKWDGISFVVHDAVGNDLWKYLVVDSTSFPSGEIKYIEVCTDNIGNLKGRHYLPSTGVWYDWDVSYGTGTGILSGPSTELYIGSETHSITDDYFDGYFPGEAINIVSYSDIYPQAGFEACVNQRRRPY